MDYPIWVWIAFNIFILALLAFDLGVFHREAKEISFREAIWTTGFYISIALLFDALVYYFEGPHKGIEFLTAYFLEYALSMDNIMVFVVVLAHFQVPPQYQMRVLIWGILGALVLRGIFIFAGIALISAFGGVVILLGAFLIYTGVRTLRGGNTASELEDSWIIRTSDRVFPVSPHYDGPKFFTRSNGGGLSVTPLFIVLIVLNVIDILFAVDSIPAVFAITRDPFIVYTSNVFAVLGLRSLYFALSGMLDKFRYLKVGLSLVLIFIGLKMIYNYPPEWPDIPTEWALIVTAVLIFGSILASLVRNYFDKSSDVIQS